MIQTSGIATDRKFSAFDFMTGADQRSLRYGIWPIPKEKRKGSTLLLVGRSEFLEKYSETIGELNQKGFDVYSFDWRGQGLSSRMLANRHKGFIDNYDIYLNDLQVFFDRIVKPEAARPLIIIAHSMGGHIALRFLHDHPDAADMAVLTSPMIDIFRSNVFRWLVKLMTRIVVQSGFKHVYAIGSGDYRDQKFNGNQLTSDPVRFMDAIKAIEKQPDLALGGVTYGWLSATLASIDILNQPGYAAKITTPILMISAGEDKIVSIKAQKKMCAWLPACRFVEIPGARHEIFKETDAVRSIIWREFERFTHMETGVLNALGINGRSLFAP
ncbi:MAG: alpha/beta hydrolase [Desulfobacterales bacterium]